MVGWLDSNPTRRKTKRGINKFINNWLAGAQDRGCSNNRGADQYQSRASQMLEQSYDMMDNWARKKEMEEHGDDN